jgi:hypothetical protein
MIPVQIEGSGHNFFEQMKCEHGDLVGSLSRVRHMLAAGQKPEIAPTIRQFCDLIEAHFLHEEEGGYLCEAVRQTPAMAARAEALLREHAELLEQLHTIRQLAESPNPSDAWLEDLGRAFEAFSRQLMVHEAREDDLLRECIEASPSSPR